MNTTMKRASLLLTASKELSSLRIYNPLMLQRGKTKYASSCIEKVTDIPQLKTQRQNIILKYKAL